MSAFIRFRYRGKLWVVSAERAKNPRVQALLRKAGTLKFRRIVKDKTGKPKLIKKTIVIPQKRVKTIRRPKRRVSETRGLTGVDYENLARIADRYGVARDLVDWNSRIDASLTYDENKSILTNYIRGLSQDATADVSPGTFEGDYAQYVSQLEYACGEGSQDACEELQILRKG